MHVVLDHAVGVLVLPGDAAQLVLHVRAEVHARAVPPDVEGLAVGMGALDEVDRGGERLVVDRLHALLGQRPGILDATVRVRADDAARAEGFAEGPAVGEHHVARVVLVLRLFLGVEVVEVAEELVEAVVGRQVLVLVAQVVLAELAGRVAVGLQQAGDGRVLFPHAELGARQADLGEAGAEHALARDERRAARGAGLLAVIVGEDHAFLGDAVDVGRPVAHQAHRVGADVGLADVVAPDDENVGLVLGEACYRESKGR